ncbi:hypothetical protein TIFTF001_039143 [Ficus carica]|uniref:Uncharacterized protein n=1 Tax=Ficus carica TaxID=3494 RepID=A0AA88JAQ3_FICCA|nr:hypothetical protein TIFTF001_039143 [Ficus carica]
MRRRSSEISTCEKSLVARRRSSEILIVVASSPLIAPVQPTLSSNPGEILRVMGRSAASRRSSEISSAHEEICVRTWEVQ